MSVTREMVEGHVLAFAATARRWQRAAPAEHAGAIPCPVARIPLQWPELFTVPVAVEACRLRGGEEDAALATGLVDFLDRIQRPDGTFDAGFCGDLAAPCNAAFGLRPLATALADWPDGLDGARRERLAGVLRRAAGACVDGGMNTANHRWVAAGGLAHAARVLGEPAFARAADDWTRATIDIDADGAYSEGSPKYAVVSNDFFLDLEELQGRRDLGDLARRSLGYLRATLMPDGDFASVGSARYDTDGSTDGYARAATVFARLGDVSRARRCLAKLWRSRTAPGLMAAVVTPPLGESGKAKLYPSTVSALCAEHLLRWLRLGVEDGPEDEPGTSRSEAGLRRLEASGLVVYRSGAFAAAAGPGPNLLEVHWGGCALEGARLLGHATGWNRLYTEVRTMEPDGMTLRMSTAPGSEAVRLPQFHRDAPDERRPGHPVPAIRASLRVRFGPGVRVGLEIALEGPERANALLELAARPDQSLFDEDGVPLSAPVALPGTGGTILGGPGERRLAVRHSGGSGHALQVDRYGYGDGDALWSPSFHPRCLRIGASLPARLSVEILPV